MSQLYRSNLINKSHPNNPSVPFLIKKYKISLIASIIVLLSVLLLSDSLIFCAEESPGRTIKMRVVTVNPSADKIQEVPIKIYLPEEVTPKDIINKGELTIEFDDQKSMYYAYREKVALKPKETRTFEVEVSDVWRVPEVEIGSLKDQTEFVLRRFENSDYYEVAKKLSDTIYKALDVIVRTQNDETVSSKSHIGIYRDNLKIVGQVKDDIAKLEKRLAIARAMPIPEVLEKTKAKTQAPSKTTTWMIIFIIITFMGMLAGVFFFTWHTQAHFTKDVIGGVRKFVFPEDEKHSSDQEPEKR